MNKVHNFALIGAAGYIAPRHMKAIKETGHKLIVSFDKNDSVGIIDSYFPDSDFFTEFERFDRHVEKLKRKTESERLDFISICSPNYLHDSHIRFALRAGAHAICEKPLVLNPWNIDSLMESEKEYNRKVFNILQLRLHPSILKLKDEMSKSSSKKHEMDLTYITSRGKWYDHSWKAETSKSGGIATNIGIHFFDMLSFVFGKVQINHLHYVDHHKASGYMEFERARVRWFLSIDNKDLPELIKEKKQRTFRSFVCDGNEVEFSSGFEDLHTKVYEHILSGKGFGLEDARTSVEIAYAIRNDQAKLILSEAHPFLIK